MRLLLHHCCAPCSPMIVAALKDTYQIESFWFNPNIRPDHEYGARKEAWVRYVAGLGFTAHEGPSFFDARWDGTSADADPERCRFCYEVRLEETARTAQRLGMDAFSTTLLASPYQNHECIKQLAQSVASRHQVRFVYMDVRARYHEGKNHMKQNGYYIQKYCGCLPSHAERVNAKKIKRGVTA